MNNILNKAITQRCKCSSKVWLPNIFARYSRPGMHSKNMCTLQQVTLVGAALPSSISLICFLFSQAPTTYQDATEETDKILSDAISNLYLFLRVVNRSTKRKRS